MLVQVDAEPLEAPEMPENTGGCAQPAPVLADTWEVRADVVHALADTE